jgi:serine/threonine-protein kinase
VADPTAEHGDLDDERPEPSVTRSEPRVIGRYRLCYELASGGMASVYLARAEGPGGFEKLVALKLIHPHLAREAHFIEMFLDEARIAARIAHGNVASVVDFGEVEGRYYIAMEYLAGETLLRVNREAKRSTDPTVRRAWQTVACRIVADLCEGLHAAHELTDERGRPLHVVHRDVSPSNLLVSYDGVARVMDFGIAKARNRLHETDTGVVEGKHGYMAPEMLSGRDYDRRVDVWAMGVVLWELLAGRRLFHRRNQAETLLAAVSEPIAPPSVYARSVSSALDAVVLRALARDPDARYATARELGRDLLRAAGAPVGLADVAELMDALFREERARKLEMMDVARDMRSEMPRLGDGGTGESVSSIRATTPRRRLPTRRALAVWFAAAIAIAFAAGLAMTSVFGAAPEPRSAASKPPASTTASVPVAVEADPAPVVTADAGPAIATAREPARPGFVNVVTPGARCVIFLRGRRLGEAPRRVELPPGTHAIELRPSGGGPAVRARVRVRSGATTPLVRSCE